MANFDLAIPKLLEKEGGSKIVNIPGDLGGLTKYGISRRSYPALDIENLTQLQAGQIYQRDYWSLCGAQEIQSQPVAELVFESAVNMGVSTTIKLVQASLDLEVDGICGPKTIAAINAYNASAFIALFKLALVARYTHICNKDPSQVKFLLGWLNRIMGRV